jgi:hypothetical protein
MRKTSRGWRHRLVSSSADGSNAVSGGQLSAQTFPGPLPAQHRLSQTLLPWRTPCGPWRAPGSNVFAFVVQSFLHELAVAAKRDHLEFLLEQLGPPRWLQDGNAGALHTGRAAGVLRLAAEKAGWGRALAPGRGLGLAFYFSHAGHVAEAAEVSVDASKRVTVHRVTVAADVGPIVNRSGAEAQCEGSVIDGVSTLRASRDARERGCETNFHRYPLLRVTGAGRGRAFHRGDFRPPDSATRPAAGRPGGVQRNLAPRQAHPQADPRGRFHGWTMTTQPQPPCRGERTDLQRGQGIGRAVLELRAAARSPSPISTGRGPRHRGGNRRGRRRPWLVANVLSRQSSAAADAASPRTARSTSS